MHTQSAGYGHALVTDLALEADADRCGDSRSCGAGRRERTCRILGVAEPRPVTLNLSQRQELEAQLAHGGMPRLFWPDVIRVVESFFRQSTT